MKRTVFNKMRPAVIVYEISNIFIIFSTLHHGVPNAKFSSLIVHDAATV